MGTIQNEIYNAEDLEKREVLKLKKKIEKANERIKILKTKIKEKGGEI